MRYYINKKLTPKLHISTQNGYEKVGSAMCDSVFRSRIKYNLISLDYVRITRLFVWYFSNFIFREINVNIFHNL